MTSDRAARIFAGQSTWNGTPLAVFPDHPRPVREALHALAETPGLTLEQYETRKARILGGHE